MIILQATQDIRKVSLWLGHATLVPGGGLSLDGSRWVASRSNFLVHVNLLARLFSGKMLAMLTDAHHAGQLKFFNAHAGLADKATFKRFIAPLRRTRWVVYCKAPFAGPEQVLRYLSRYTHRVAISNRRLIAADHAGVAFRWKDYRIDGPGRWKTMRLHPHEFIRRFLLHVLPTTASAIFPSDLLITLRFCIDSIPYAHSDGQKKTGLRRTATDSSGTGPYLVTSPLVAE